MSRIIEAGRVLLGAEPSSGADFQDAILKLMVGKGMLLEHNLSRSFDKLIRQKDYTVIDDMRRDDAVKAAIGLKMSAPVSVGWTVEPASDENEHMKHRDFILANFERLKGTLEDRMQQITLALAYGFSVNEIVLAVEKFGPWSGKWMLDKLLSQAPHNLMWTKDDDGFVDGVKQNTTKAPEVPLYKVIKYTWQGDFENPWGRPDLEAAYAPWFSKDVARRMWNIYLEWFAFGKWKTTYSKATMKDVAEAFAAKLPQAISLTTPEGLETEIIEATGRGSQTFKEAIDAHDQAIARSILKQTLAQGEGERHGSLAQARVHQDTFLLDMATVAGDVQETCMTEQLIKPLIDLNFGVQEKYPHFKLDELFPEAPKEFIDTYLDLIEKGGIVPTKADEDRIRDLANLPPREGDDPPSALPAAVAAEPAQMSTDTDGHVHSHIDTDSHSYVPTDRYVSHFAAGSRALTKFEKRINFAAVEDRLNTVEDTALIQLVDVITVIEEKMLAQVNSKFYTDGVANAHEVNRFKVPMLSSIKSIINASGQTLFRGAHQDVAFTMKKAGLAAGHAGALRFAAVNPGGLSFEQQSAAFITNWAARSTSLASQLGAQIERDLQVVLLHALQNGESQAVTTRKITQMFEKWLPGSTKGGADINASPFRLETMVRTNFTSAYSQGRLIAGQDPDLAGFILAMLYSAVLDERTTEICETLDGTIIAMDDPQVALMTSPNHFSCRGVWVEIVQGDEFTISTDKQIANAVATVPSTFR